MDTPPLRWQARLDAQACRLSSPGLPELRLERGSGWLVLSGDGLKPWRVPPTRRHAAWAVAGCWSDPKWAEGTGGHPPAAVPAPDRRVPGRLPSPPARLLAIELERAGFSGFLAGFPPEVRAVWRRLQACRPLPLDLPCAIGPLEEWFWGLPYLAGEVRRFTGAALVVRAMMDTWCAPEYEPEWKTLAAGDWLRVCSPGGGPPNRALRSTLARCPLPLPSDRGSVLDLSGVVLTRPRRTVLEVVAAIAAGRHRLVHRASSVNQRLFLEADDQSLQAIRPVRGRGRGGRHGLLDAMLELLDCPVACGDLPSLIHESERWREVPGYDLGRHGAGPGGVADLAPETRIPQPIIPFRLPTGPDVRMRFLGDVAAIRAEDVRMRHGIAIYTPDAVARRCYLFHLEAEGSEATLLYDRFGRLVEARGPGNAPSPAARFAEERLPRLW